MAKRFTDTEKFIDPWYRRLSTKNKLLWEWLLCGCDHAGIVTIDFEFIEMVLCEKYEDTVLDDCFSDRIIKLGSFKYFIPKFLRFQYGKLNPQSKVHASVIQRLKDEGVIYNDFDSIKDIENNARSIGYGYSMDTVKEKDKAKAKDKDKDKVSINTAPEKNLPEIQSKDFRNSKDSQKITPDHIVDLWNQKMGAKYGHAVGLGSGKHLTNCLESIKHLPDMESWESLFLKCEQSKHLRGENDIGWTVTLTWIVNFDNAVRVLSEEFNDSKNINNLFASIKTGESA